MSAKSSFFMMQRIIFVLLSIQFTKKIFYRWDGYSFYMRFVDFLPDLSLTFLLWTIPGVVAACVLWLTAYCLFRFGRIFDLEHITAWCIAFLFAVNIKHFFFYRMSMEGYTVEALLITGVVLALIIRGTRKYTGKVLNEINVRIIPLVWIFAFLLIAAVPFSAASIFRKIPPPADYVSDATADRNRPNIILVTWDTLSAVDMDTYGYDLPTTPFLSEWAGDAVVFRKAYAASNWTPPTTMSLMTGQRVWTHGIWYSVYNFPVKKYEQSLPDVLRKKGYNIYGFIQNQYAHPDNMGIGRNFITKEHASEFDIHPRKKAVWKIIGFINRRPIVDDLIKTYPFSDFYRTAKKEVQGKIQKMRSIFTRKTNSAAGGKPARSDDYVINTATPPDIVYKRFLDYVSSSRDQTDKTVLHEPFFAWLHLYPPHEPYHPPEPYKGRFRRSAEVSAQECWKSIKNYGTEDQTRVDDIRQCYDEFILYCDEQFRIFIKSITEKIDLSNTIIIMSADHGENFSHGYQGHGGPHLYEPVVNIPLIIKMNGGGRVIDMPVEQTDIAPTVLALAGIPVPEWMEGRSLLPLINGSGFDSRPVFSMQFMRNRSLGHPITRGTIAVWDGDYKLIYYLKEKRALLFNIKSDPGETRNLAGEKPSLAGDLIAVIEENLSRANERIRTGRTAAGPE